MDANNHTVLVSSVLSAIKKQRPELAEYVSQMDGSPAVGLKLELSRGRSIIFGWMKNKRTVQWMTVMPDQTLTPLQSGETVEDIASGLIEAYDRFDD